ncbi:acyltransferase [Flavobacterium sp. LHD-80]|uniref:acyltransferase family protein n=1 Tax=Flavobacterium sp. LHD-80 TaxID=3071411 RepID=UPI0027DFA788|nr:acyltransferase [Flavobacterium sp. LHD-80]MDQ6472080.1 acyltransferase [Flavobacterium sp. LHD-80]
MKNNFDFLRLIFALFVVIAHSYPLSGSNISENWLGHFTNDQTEFSSLGVNGFFIISGYLIFQSLDRSKTLTIYFWKRVLRLFPALFVVLLLTLILAPFVYEGSMYYLQNKSVYWYMIRNLSLYNLKYDIKGVFENNPYPSAINGSLWTICYEFTFYILLAFLFFMKNKKAKQGLILGAFLIMFVIEVFSLKLFEPFNFYGLSSFYLLEFGTFFMGGALLAVVKIEKINRKPLLMGFSVLALITSFYFGFYNNVKYIFLTFTVILLGIQSFRPFNEMHKIGDFSYGVYIYSFPIQQTLMYFFKFDTLHLMFWSVLASLLFGYLSWNLVEKKFLKLKDFFSGYSPNFQSLN